VSAVAAGVGECPSAEQLACLVDGRLAADEVAELRRHAGECEECCALMASLARGVLDDATARTSVLDTDDERDADEATAFVPSSGVRLGRYVLLDRLGSGAMGVVWRAADPELERHVAIKLLAAGVTGSAVSEGAARLQREAQSMAKLSHPNVVTVLDVGMVADQVFLAMELVEGQTLRQWLADRPRSRTEILARFVAAGTGLAHAHAQGIVHRDFKPDNVLCGTDGRVCVTDFGLARYQATVHAPTPTIDDDETELERLTRTGMFVGTPAYMAPEQIAGRDADERSDQFSFCIALWEALFGIRPFAGQSFAALATAVASGSITEPPVGHRVPRPLERVLRRGLEVDPAKRWPDLVSLLAAIDRARPVPRRALVLGAIVVGLASAGVWWAVRDRASVEPCTGATARLAGVWDDERRDAVREALLATGVPWAQAAAQGAAERLDAHAADWVAMHTDACRATASGEQAPALLDRRMACLERRREELSALVDVLAQADAAAAERAVQAAASLPPVAVCGDLEALSAELPPPEDPAKAQAVRAQIDALARASARGQAGAWREALEAATEVVDAASELGWPPLSAEALLLRGKLRRQLGEYDEAHADLQEAWELARAAGHDRIAAHAASEQVVLATKRLAFDDGATWGRHALALARRVGEGQEAEAEACSDVGLLSLHRGELDEAQQLLQRALELREQLPRPDPERIAETVGRLGDLALVRQDLAAASVHYARAVALLESTLGPEHPMLVAPVLNLGGVHYRRFELDEAERAFRRALALHERAHAEPHPDLVVILTNLGNLELARSRQPAALAHYERALALAEELFGPDHSQVGVVLVNVAMLRHALGDHEGARAAFQRTLEQWERDLPGNPALAYPLTGLGAALVDLGRPADARPHLERALALRQGAPSSPIELADAEHHLARALWDDGGDRARALALARAAVDRLVAVGDETAEHRRPMEQWLAEHRAP
jgi:tetratricopeptide (TPR) repeat protein